MRPETRVRRISPNRYIAAAQAATIFNVLSGSSTPRNPSGYSSSIKAVVMSPEQNFGWSITADKNGILCPIPSISNVSNAWRICTIAASRVGAQVHSFAIIGS